MLYFLTYSWMKESVFVVKLEDLLQLPLYRHAEVAAGKAGVSRSVQSVNMMDAPDIIDFLKPDELLLTTAYAMKDQPDALYRLVSDMAACGCAGLGLKTKRFLQEIPADVLELAERLAFPVIELPLDVSLGDLLNEALGFILETRTSEMRYALEMHRRFSGLVMEGKGIAEVIEALSMQLKVPVLLIDYKYSCYAQSRSVKDRIPEAIVRHLEQTVKEFVSLESGSVTLGLTGLQDSSLREISVLTIRTPPFVCYLILFGSTEEPVEGHFSKLVTEQAINVIGFEMMKIQAVKERSRRFKNEFFSDLVEGLVRSEQEMMNRGKNYGIIDGSAFQCIVGKLDTVSAPAARIPLTEERVHKDRDAMYSFMKRSLQIPEVPFVLFTKNDLFVFILMPSPLTLPSVLERKVLEQLSGLQSALRRKSGTSLSFGVGRLFEKVSDIPHAYKEACDALQTGYTLKKTAFIHTYSAKDTMDLLRRIPNEDLRVFFTETFRRLLETDEQEDLMNTLRTFLESHCQIAETAKKMYLHRNTIIYRLQKCEDLTRRSLKDPTDTIRLRIGFLIEALLAESRT